MATKKAKPEASEDGDKVTFEQALERLGKIVEELENGDLSLEDSLRRFEEGVRLSRASQAELDRAEARIEELLSIDDDGDVELSRMDV